MLENLPGPRVVVYDKRMVGEGGKRKSNNRNTPTHRYCCCCYYYYFVRPRFRRRRLILCSPQQDTDVYMQGPAGSLACILYTRLYVYVCTRRISPQYRVFYVLYIVCGYVVYLTNLKCKSAISGRRHSITYDEFPPPILVPENALPPGWTLNNICDFTDLISDRTSPARGQVVPRRTT